MKNSKLNKRLSRKDYLEVLSVKDINKKVKEPIPTKEKESEYNLVLIIKSLNSVINNIPKNLISSNNSRQELNYSDIELYLKKFHSKPYYKYKIFPLLEILETIYIKTKKEKAFLNSAKEMNITINEENKIVDSQIDRLNYILISHYEKLLLLDNDVYDIFFYLKDIFPYLYDEYIHLLNYYLLIQLHTFNLLGVKKLKESKKNNGDKKKYNINVTKILFDIIYRTNNLTLVEIAFILFCQYYLNFRDGSFIFLPIDKWVFLILKLLKGEIYLFNENDEERDYFSLGKIIHLKYVIGETRRNKTRKKILEQEFDNKSENNNDEKIENEDELKSPNSSKEFTFRERHSFLPAHLCNLDKYKDISSYLEDKTYDSYPKELSLPRGPSEIFLINLYKYTQSEKEKMKKNKDYCMQQKLEVIQGALTIADKILKFNYDSKEYSEYDEKYFCTKLLEEIMKLYLNNKDLHIIKRCLNCFGSIMNKYPYKAIDFVPQIIKRLVQNELIGEIEHLVNHLNYVVQSCNTVFQMAYDENNFELIKKINYITVNKDMIDAFVFLNPYIFKLKVSKTNSNNIKNSDKINTNSQTLMTNYFIFCSFFINNYLLLNHGMMTINMEIIIIDFVEKTSSDLVRKYMIKIIAKINNKELLNRIYNYLFIDENKNLKLKTLLYVFRYVSSEKHNKKNLYLLIKFLEENNNNINKTSASKILDFLAKHITNKETKFYFVDFHKDKNSKKSITSEFGDEEKEYVEIYDISHPKYNTKIFNFIKNLFFFCINQNKELDDISNIHKILSILCFNLVPIETNNIYILLDFLVEYLNTINQQINLQGHKIWQNHFKQYLEILNYINSYISIKNNKNKEAKLKIDENYIQKLINSYNKIILILFKLIPSNLSSREYESLNIIPVIYSYLLTLENLSQLNKKENNCNIEKSSKKENNVYIELLNILSKCLINNINNKPSKSQTLNSCNISLYYIFYYLKNFSKKEYFDSLYSIIIKSLNIDEFKYDNNIINPINFILIKLCVKILYEEKDFITNEYNEYLSSFDKKYLFIQKLHTVIMEGLHNDGNNAIINSNSSNNIEESNLSNKTILAEQSIDQKMQLINKYLNFSPKSNFININMDNFSKKDENTEIKIEKYKETKDNVNCKYQKWLIFLDILSKSKSKKSKNTITNTNYDVLLNSSFSLTENRPIHFVSIIKSVELDKSNFQIFSNFFTILGNILVNENKVVFKKENIFENIIFSFNRNILHNIVFVLIKKYFEEFDAHFSANFVIYIKPANLQGIYFVKIRKTSDFKMKNNTCFKLLTQIDQDFNRIFSDFIILDTNDKNQIKYFYNLIEMMFNYSFLEEQISQ